MKKFALIPLLSLFLLITGLTEATGSTLKKGPYLVYEGPNTEMKVLWQNDASSLDVIKWGTSTLYTGGSASSTEYGSDHQHTYTITGLTPGTKYYYQVEISGVNFEGSFRAAPDASANTLKFLAYGDTRTYPNDHNLVAEKINAAWANDPEYQTVLISMGDLIADGNSESSWANEFFETGLTHINSMLSNLPYHVARGNHEGNGVLLEKYFPYNYQSSRYYSFEYGPALFMVLDQYVSYAPGSAQYIWLENELATTSKAWKILYFHEPGWAAGSTNSSIQNYIQPLCEQYGVKITFAGHHHYYSRAEVTLNNTTVTHITTGGGGAPLYAPNPSAQYIVSASQSHHFCKIDIVDNNIMNVEVVDKYGAVIDQFTVDQTYVPPTYVDITDPADNTHYTSPQTITISADASDPDGIQQVEFFVAGSSVGIDNTSPYSLQYTIPADDNYIIYAEMTDDLSNTLTSDAINIIVGGNPPVYVSSRIITGNDDVEESQSGFMYMNSTDLELGYDDYNSQGNQTIGLRFTGLNIPQGASISSASIEFTVDETNAGACNLLIKGHDVDDSEVYTSASYNVSARPTTSASVNWSPADWTAVGAKETTPELLSIIQEIVDRPGFSGSSAISLIITGSGTRTAEAYEGDATSAALLQIVYTAGNNPPVFTTDPIVELNANINQAYSSSIADNATDADGDDLTFTKVTGPAWLTVGANGDLSGTPGSGDIGLNSWEVQVADGNGGTDNAMLEIEVVDPLVINYCASHGNATNEWIEIVSIADESYQSGTSGAAGYQDLTETMTFSLASGSTNNISLTPGFSPRSKFEYWKVWIDFDLDGIFEDTEIVYYADKKKTLVTGTITIPAISPVQTTMRVSMKRGATPASCEIFSLGEVEDYSVDIVEAGSLPPVADFTSDNNTIYVGGSVQFTDLSYNDPGLWSWTFGDGGTSTLQHPTATYNTAGVYDVSLTVTNDNGSDTETKLDYLTVLELPSSYCASSGSSTALEWIQSIAVDGVPYESGDDGGYGDFTNTTINLTSGSSANMVLTPGFTDKSQREFWRVWIDFNANMVFDPDEEVITANNTKAIVNSTFLVPTGISVVTTMRVSMKQGSAQTSCEAFSRGEVEDYTVNIAAGAGDGITLGSLSDNTFSEKTVNVYPNPTSGKLFIQLDGWEGDKEIRLIEMTGRSIHSEITNKNFVVIDASSFEKGIYLFVVNDGYSLDRKKIIIQ
ncbi:MAG: GEVED domain-containing protein [Bacteroidota bacterium]